MAKILYISFGYEPYWSGGMVKEQIGLMKCLISIGHKVTYFTACRYDFRRSVYLSDGRVNGIETIEMVNSPNLYDPYCYVTNPASHCSNRIIEGITNEVVERVKPDLVHVSDLRMHCASVIRLLRKRNVPVVKTIHNFWDLCPKGDLMFNDESPCIDFNEGKNCIVCLSKYGERDIPLIHRIKGSVNYKYWFPIIAKFGRLKKYLSQRREQTIDTIGGAAQYFPEAYLNRRKYFVSMLNECNVVHTTSRKIAQRLINYGVNPDIIKPIPLSAAGLSEITRKGAYRCKYPVVFGYRGKLHTRKGIQFLLSAFSCLDQKRCKLLIYGDGNLDLLKPYIAEKRNIEYRGTYRKNHINHVLAEIDIGVVPSVWEEIFGIVGLEYLNAGIPVIGSNIGGISEWLKNGENGFLFRAGNSNELFALMNRFVENPSLIADLQQKMKPWKDAKEYAYEIGEVYRNVLK